MIADNFRYGRPGRRPSRRLVQSLHEAAKDRLVIITGHRLSTIAHANKIVFLKDGRVMEQGSHDELVATPDGHYRRFVELQTTASA